MTEQTSIELNMYYIASTANYVFNFSSPADASYLILPVFGKYYFLYVRFKLHLNASMEVKIEIYMVLNFHWKMLHKALGNQIHDRGLGVYALKFESTDLEML